MSGMKCPLRWQLEGLSSSPFPPWGLSSAREQGRGGASLTRVGAGASPQRRWSLWLLTFAPPRFFWLD